MLSCLEGLDGLVSREPCSREPWTVRGRPAVLSCFGGLDGLVSRALVSRALVSPALDRLVSRALVLRGPGP